MSLRFVFGASGAGKSTYLRKEVLENAARHPDKLYFLVVPDQYTLQTQKEMVTSSPVGGILNIDVLSFGRLSHRVLEEIGALSVPVLDDTGKNLVLRLVAERLEKDLPILGQKLRRPGYIHEVKSAISEFQQYGIGVEDLTGIIEKSASRGALRAKLQELQILYRGFQDYIRDHYITTEETLQVVAKGITGSEKCKGADFIFDGFTGFTPIQLQVIESLLSVAGRVTFSLTLEADADPYKIEGEQKLFALTQKTVKQLQDCAFRNGITEEKEVRLPEKPVPRFTDSPELAYLERNLFRYRGGTYPGEIREGLTLSELSDLRQEARYAARTIRSLVRKEGYQYREMAVVCGDLDSYAPHIRSEFQKLDIPFFLDKRGAILLNPFAEFIKSALTVILRDYSPDSVSHYLHCGLTGVTREEADLLEQYVMQMGIRGRKKWQHEFLSVPLSMKKKEDQTAYLLRINDIRVQILESLASLHGTGETAKDRCADLSAFIEKARIRDRLLSMEQAFAKSGDGAREKEYHQIYGYITDMIARMGELLGDETLSAEEFYDLLDAGFAEMKVGIIPGGVDRLLVGDMERTRLNNVKVLFFLGTNDGNIPGKGGSGGIISDPDREFLALSGVEVAPSPRQKMFIQRLYLYMNLTKPSERLYISYACMNGDGASLRPAYLVDTLRRMFPGLKTQHPEADSEYLRMESCRDGRSFLAGELRRFASGEASADAGGTNSAELSSALKLYDRFDAKEKDTLLNAAFIRYNDLSLGGKLALRLYGEAMKGSVSRLETYASCPYAHFLQYGMGLKEKEERTFETSDMGSLFHGILKEFSEKLLEKGYTLRDFPEEEGKKLLDRLTEEQAIRYGFGVLYDNARNTMIVRRVKRILHRTVDTLQYQLLQGDMLPEAFEKGYIRRGDGIPVKGVMDRLDSLFDPEKGKLARIIDYKSGQNRFDLELFYNGLKIQLMTYLSAAMEESGGKVCPAGALYYHLDDPMLDMAGDAGEDTIREALFKELRMTGVINGDPEVVRHMDRAEDGTYRSLKLTAAKDGTLKENKDLRVMKEEDLRTLAAYADHLIQRQGREILEGRISLSPYESGKDRKNACIYCAYKAVCGFDTSIPGCSFRQVTEGEQADLMDRIREELA